MPPTRSKRTYLANDGPARTLRGSLSDAIASMSELWMHSSPGLVKPDQSSASPESDEVEASESESFVVPPVA